MVGLLSLPKTTFPSLSSFDCHLLYPKAPPMASSLSTLHHKECLLWNFSEAQKFRLKPLPSQVCFRHSKRVFIQCGCFDSPSGSGADNGKLYSLFVELGLDEKETEALLDKSSALTLLSLDSVRARILSLQSVGIDDFALCLLITKRPDLVTSCEVDQFIRFVLDDLGGKIEASQIERLFSTTKPSSLAGFDQKVSLLLERGVPEEKIIHVLNNVNLKGLCVKSIQELDRIITFLSPFGGIGLIVKRPKLMNYDLESQLIPRIGFLTELSGGDEHAVGTVLGKLPAILNYTVKHYEGHAEFLRSFAGLEDKEIFKIVLVYPNVFSASRVRKLYPRIELLKQCGLDSEEIFKFLIKAPLFLSLSFGDNIAHKLVLLLKIGFKHRTKDLAVAMGSVSRTSCANMQKVVGLYLSYGLSCEDIYAMCKRQPQVLQYSYSSLKEKMEYLIEEMGREIGELLAFPAFLGYKFDDRIKARYESKRTSLGEGMSLNKLLTVSTKTFSQRRKEIPLHAIEDSKEV